MKIPEKITINDDVRHSATKDEHLVTLLLVDKINEIITYLASTKNTKKGGV